MLSTIEFPSNAIFTLQVDAKGFLRSIVLLSDFIINSSNNIKKSQIISYGRNLLLQIY